MHSREGGLRWERFEAQSGCTASPARGSFGRSSISSDRVPFGSLVSWIEVCRNGDKARLRDAANVVLAGHIRAPFEKLSCDSVYGFPPKTTVTFVSTATG